MRANYVYAKAYKPILDAIESEKAIKLIKDFFQTNLADAMKLRRVTAPLFVKSGTGINDDLNGTEKPVKFYIKDMENTQAEIVHSLAKWKRMKLAQLDIKLGQGIYTDMNAIRPDEQLDSLHSLYVDQWDWEQVISEDDRNIGFLQNIVSNLYQVMKKTENFLHAHYPNIKPELPEKLEFIHSLDLEKRYPAMLPQEREYAVSKKYGAVFICGIGAALANGDPHDGRAPDYDDWLTPTKFGPGLNGDIIVWNSVLERAFELTSMGIRVDAAALDAQLKLTGTTDRREYTFHKKLLNNELPLSVGGGIGQSRLCMFFLKKAHIGEVQASIWPEKMIKDCKENNILLL